MSGSPETVEHGPWNPGLSSQIPQRLMPEATLYRQDNATVTYNEARELSDVFGLSVEDVASFKAERLVIHEIMVRVTADLSVRDGPNYEDLGISLRGMVDTVFQRYAKPELSMFEALLEGVRAEATSMVMTELSATVFASSGTQENKKPQSFLSRLFGKQKAVKKHSSASPEQIAIAAVANWGERSQASSNALEKATLNALQKVVGTIVGHRGRLINDTAIIARLSAVIVCNSYGSEKIGEALESILKKAVDAEGYRFLPMQQKPVIMNVKGASASGKSTIRNQQRELAKRIGVSWEDFALISPDYWRKYLIDYDGLGDDYKYAAMLTGRELEIIDKKLDAYMTDKAARGAISHLLIDRFRFDSFAPRKLAEADSRLLTRFGDTIYLFFMITPPEETVERAWARGLTTGRYKAVDDLLYHNIEAYTGMAQLFFSWATSTNKKVRYEFLDNSVPKGERPRTVAFGWNDDMTILDLDVMMKIETFKHINIEAHTRSEVYDVERASSQKEATFLEQCADVITNITLASINTGAPYAHLKKGKCIWRDDDHKITESIENVFGIKGDEVLDDNPSTSIDVFKEQRLTVGRWGEALSAMAD